MMSGSRHAPSRSSAAQASLRGGRRL